MTENCSYNSKAQKNNDAGVLIYSFACKYYFLIARRFEPHPPSKGKQANPVEIFLLSAAVHVILNGVVVTVLNTSQVAQVQIPEYSHIFYPLASTIKTLVFIICITFLLIL